jgi:hypothetical protein
MDLEIRVSSVAKNFRLVCVYAVHLIRPAATFSPSDAEKECFVECFPRVVSLPPSSDFGTTIQPWAIFFRPFRAFNLNSRQFVKFVSKSSEFGVSPVLQHEKGVSPLNEFIQNVSGFV